MKLDTTFFPFAIEKRSIEGSNQTYLEGIACPYNSWSQVMGGHFKEMFLPGAFMDSLGKRNVLCTNDHTRDKFLGSSNSGTLRIEERAEGLFVSLLLPNTTIGLDLLTMVNRRDVAGMSFDFMGLTDEWAHEEGIACRTISKAELYEVCFTPDPAYLSTNVEISQRSKRNVPERVKTNSMHLNALKLKLHNL